MTSMSKLFQSFSEDINSEESLVMKSFEKVTSIFFQGTIWTAIPLFIYFLYTFFM